MSAPYVSSLLSELARGAPWLPGARCRGRPALFDPKRSGEDGDVARARHQQAIQLCQGCPSLARCGDWLDGLDPGARPSGVVAGRKQPTPPTQSSAARGW